MYCFSRHRPSIVLGSWCFLGCTPHEIDKNVDRYWELNGLRLELVCLIGCLLCNILHVPCIVHCYPFVFYSIVSCFSLLDTTVYCSCLIPACFALVRSSFSLCFSLFIPSKPTLRYPVVSYRIHSNSNSIHANPTHSNSTQSQSYPSQLNSIQFSPTTRDAMTPHDDVTIPLTPPPCLNRTGGGRPRCQRSGRASPQLPVVVHLVPHAKSGREPGARHAPGVYREGPEYRGRAGWAKGGGGGWWRAGAGMGHDSRQQEHHELSGTGRF